MTKIISDKKTICWITSDFFLDLDMPIVKSLSNDYIIHWYVVFSFTNSRFKPEELQTAQGIADLHIHQVFSKYRLRNLKNISFYYNILTKIKKTKPDIVYVNFIGLPFLIFIASILLRKSNTIFTAHQAIVHEGLEYKSILKIYFRFMYSYFKYFNLFSITQANIFKKLHPTKKLFITPISLKDFGTSNKKRIDDKIVFLYFGSIRANKNVGCLIDAACNLYDKGIKGFHIVIKGECDNWEHYSRRIRFPELFTCDIRLIDNNEIADMFHQFHYLVLPYSTLTQSGPIKIAFHYNIPVIASDLEGFKLDIEDGVNGYLFKNKDVDDLEFVLKKAIENHNDKYESLRVAQKNFVDRNYSFQSILEKYQSMFNSFNN